MELDIRTLLIMKQPGFYCKEGWTLMKKKYRIIITILGIEVICIFILSELNVQINSKIGTILGLIGLFVPVLTLLKLMSRDHDMKPEHKILSKILYVFLMVCCMAGIVVKMLGLEK